MISWPCAAKSAPSAPPMLPEPRMPMRIVRRGVRFPHCPPPCDPAPALTLPTMRPQAHASSTGARLAAAAAINAMFALAGCGRAAMTTPVAPAPAPAAQDERLRLEEKRVHEDWANLARYRAEN